ncbi:hypothetical protein [Micromonospora sp. NPDC005806]|uniref:hypothetical protein n=1 Tax=Micromonospora sp. NPDC005806 TaxID=3364234 RepID=UPI0036C11774
MRRHQCDHHSGENHEVAHHQGGGDHAQAECPASSQCSLKFSNGREGSIFGDEIGVYALTVIEHASPRIRILGDTAYPTAARVTRASRNLRDGPRGCRLP